ncbi:MAG: YihY/virulence factor BrkB family protein, partial [Rhizomicrobium sp.]
GPLPPDQQRPGARHLRRRHVLCAAGDFPGGRGGGFPLRAVRESWQGQCRSLPPAFLPGGAIDIVGEQLRRTIAKDQNTLGLAAIVGFLFSLWWANSGIKSLFDALNIVHRENEKRGFFASNGLSLLFTIGLLIAIAVAVGAAIWVSSWLQNRSLLVVWPVSIVGVAALWAALTFAIALLYRFRPSCSDISWRWISWGSALAALGWLCLSVALSRYAANFGSFDKTYGSLGAAVGFMTWIWLSTVVILCGEEINEILEGEMKPEPPSVPLRLPGRIPP